MIDPRREAIFTREKSTGEFVDRTRDVIAFRPNGNDGAVDIVFKNNPKTYQYGPGACSFCGTLNRCRSRRPPGR